MTGNSWPPACSVPYRRKTNINTIENHSYVPDSSPKLHLCPGPRTRLSENVAIDFTTPAVFGSLDDDLHPKWNPLKASISWPWPRRRYPTSPLNLRRSSLVYLGKEFPTDSCAIHFS